MLKLGHYYFWGPARAVAVAIWVTILTDEEYAAVRDLYDSTLFRMPDEAFIVQAKTLHAIVKRTLRFPGLGRVDHERAVVFWYGHSLGCKALWADKQSLAEEVEMRKQSAKIKLACDGGCWTNEIWRRKRLRLRKRCVAKTTVHRGSVMSLRAYEAKQLWLEGAGRSGRRIELEKFNLQRVKKLQGKALAGK
eukprot:1132850-Amphidinium_carterae.1